MAKALTVKAIDQIRTATNRQELPDGLLSGLYLIVQPSGVKSWAVRYRFRGQPKKYTIGSYPGIDLSAARDLARRALVAVAEGRDPSADKKAARLSLSDEERGRRDATEVIVASYLERHAKANTRESTWRETERLFTKEVLPAWRGRRVQSITKRDVIELLDRIIDRGSPITANRVLGKLKTFFSWALQRGLVDASPCAAVLAPSAEQSRDRVLSDREIALVWAAADELGFPFGAFVKMLLLTGQRRDEVAAMRWSEVDERAKLWTIPRQRVKNNQEHDVPLSEQVVALLCALPRIADRDEFVFTTTGETPISGYSRAKDRLDTAAARLGRGEELPAWRFHDLRRTVASGMARLGVNLPVIEKVLNHTSGSFGGIVGVYQRHTFAEEKRRALDAWGDFVGGMAAFGSTERR